MTKKINALRLFACLVLASDCTPASHAVTIHHAAATPSSQVERKVIQRTDFEGTDEELELVEVTFPPGAESPPHLHPVVGLNFILEGTAESQYEGAALETYVAGQSYQDQANCKHLVFRNKSHEVPLKFLIAFKIKKGASFKLDLPRESASPLEMDKQKFSVE